MTDQLASRLLEAIEAKEQKARTAHPEPWLTHRDGDGCWIVFGDEKRIVAHVYAGYDMRFIADNDPSSVLRRCKADRDILAMYDERFSDDVIWRPILEAMARGYGLCGE